MYICRQTLPWLIIGLAGAAFLFLTTQLVRIAPIFAGARVTPTALGEAMALLSVPIVGWAILPAFLVALFAVAGKMSAEGELTALDALGITKRQRMVRPLCFALLLTLPVAVIWLDLAPRAERRLYAVAVDLSEKALLAQLVPGRISTPLPGLTFFSEQETHNIHKNVFVEWTSGEGPSRQIMAEKATLLRYSRSGTLGLRFERGHLFLMESDTDTAVSFDTLTIPIPIGQAVLGRIDFIPKHLTVATRDLLGPPPPEIGTVVWKFTLWRRVAAPVGFIVLAVCGLLLAFGVSWQSRGAAVVAATLLFVAYHLLGRFFETLMIDGRIPPAQAAFLPIPAAVLFCALQAVALARLETLRHRPPVRLPIGQKGEME